MPGDRDPTALQRVQNDRGFTFGSTRLSFTGHYALLPQDLILHLSLPVGDLGTAKAFYVDVLGCRLGRVREDWIDVWFFGMQLTLQRRPTEVRSVDDQGVRHFGVALNEQHVFEAVAARLSASEGVYWITRPTTHQAADMSGKTEIKIADPSGNVIEIKFYPDVAEYRAVAQ